jgi:PAS domain S-box-containing protein
LIVEDQVVGVVAAFARQPITVAGYQAFALLAGSIAQFLARKRAEVAVLDSEEKLRLLLDSAAEAIYGMDLQGNCTLANRACLELLGYAKQEDLLGKNLHQVMHHSRADGSPHPMAECRIHQAFRKGERAHLDDEVLWRADGTSFPAEYWSYPVWKSGQMVGAVGTFLDISARRRAEEERHKLVALVETSSDFIVIASPEGKILYLNQGGSKMVGLESPRQAVGMDISAFHPESARERIQNKIIPSVLKTGHCQEETQLRHQNGAIIDVLMNAFLLRKANTAEVICLAAVMRDITLRKRAEGALRTSEERFRIAAENASDMVYEWDLRTGEVEVWGQAIGPAGRLAGSSKPCGLEEAGSSRRSRARGFGHLTIHPERRALQQRIPGYRPEWANVPLFRAWAIDSKSRRPAS